MKHPALALATAMGLLALSQPSNAAEPGPSHITRYVVPELKLHKGDGTFLERKSAALLPKVPVKITDMKPELNLIGFMDGQEQKYVFDGQVTTDAPICPVTHEMAWIPPGRSNGAGNAGASEGQIGCVLRKD